ncbi:hypothetical protein CLOBOL_02033 [Enterocloster bolteae ATCC BAA-613]|uniref:Uncharacterized protein n=1 Tax=Enterocloster bolteae (strain ATCC BAA-613 / DSM 15670 / CCUG 46953 / JCM 12243 / WAL 16351) TaxID=411902 RepID=A8RMU9_ENTBW|nr:hypothetical protein CLOBOL_02033 [Enterocloster bolteae ATCC BAA-613]
MKTAALILRKSGKFMKKSGRDREKCFIRAFSREPALKLI